MRDAGRDIDPLLGDPLHREWKIPLETRADARVDRSVLVKHDPPVDVVDLLGRHAKEQDVSAVTDQVKTVVEPLFAMPDGLDDQIRHRAARQLAHDMDHVFRARH